jgi:hypothetical protein
MSHLQASFVQMNNYKLKMLRIMGSHTALQVIKVPTIKRLLIVLYYLVGKSIAYKQYFYLLNNFNTTVPLTAIPWQHWLGLHVTFIRAFPVLLE